MGEEGPTGRNGVPGVEGPRGREGKMGVDGDKGVRGSPGRFGFRGIKGKKVSFFYFKFNLSIALIIKSINLFIIYTIYITKKYLRTPGP